MWYWFVTKEWLYCNQLSFNVLLAHYVIRTTKSMIATDLDIKTD